MKQFFTLLFSILLFASMNAQYGIDPEVILLETDGEDFEVKVEVTNNTGAYADIFWMYEKGENYPEAWKTTICDDTLCYLADRFKSNANLPNQMESGYSFKFKFTIEAHGIEGSSYAIIHLYDDGLCVNEVATSNPPITSVNENELEALTIYPNPSQDFFGIKNDENIHSIDVLNYTGQLQFRASHEKGELHSIYDLSNGIFVVVLKDSNDEIIKSLYLTKR